MSTLAVGTTFNTYGYAMCPETGRLRAIETERVKESDGSRVVRSGFMAEGPTWPATAKGHRAAGDWSLVNSVHAYAVASDADFAEHRAADPHCTCNDCIAHHAANLKGE